MRAIKIDVTKKEIYEVEITDDIKTIYKHLGCDCFCQVGRGLKSGDMLLVDDNGLLHEKPIGAFTFGTYPQPLSGHGIFIGTDEAGETIDAQSDIEFIRTQVRFTDVKNLPEPEFKIIIP